MSLGLGNDVAVADAANLKSKPGLRSYPFALAAAVMCLACSAFAGVAEAHGPVAPIATSYRAEVAQLPSGMDAKVIDGDQRLWLRVAPSETVVVLDYRGAPYLRFARTGVTENQNSEMYYLNQTPAEVPPTKLGPTAPPRWSRAGQGDDYSWHDGRLHALATVATTPGSSYVGRWSIPLRVNGHPGVIAGALWHAADPSLVWFWPIIVLILCTLAARRVNRPALDLGVGRVLAISALGGIVVAAAGRDLHGRPTVSVLQLLTLAIVCMFVVWASRQLVVGRTTYFTFFAVGFVAIWEGANLIPTLLNGFVLAAAPAFLTRAACVVCVGCGIGLLLIRSQPSAESEFSDAEGDGQDGEDSWLWGRAAD